MKRALMNLMNNGVRHNPEGCRLVVRLADAGEDCSLEVYSSGEMEKRAPADVRREGGVNADGSAPHGTGLKLVEQIARAHGGEFHIRQEGAYVCGQIILPINPH